MALRISVVLAFSVVLSGANGAVANDNQAEYLRAELEAILALDQQYRAPNGNHKWSEVASEQEKLDRRNLERVLRLVDSHGWPRISEVGENAALAALLVVQHADLEVQERLLPVMRSMVALGEARGAWFALLTDRIRVQKGLSQIYGTQSRHNAETGESELLPIQNPQEVNSRRLALGLKPLSRFPVPSDQANED